MPHAKFHCPELNWDVLNIYIHCLTTKSFFSLVFEGNNCLQLFRGYRMYMFFFFIKSLAVGGPLS